MSADLSYEALKAAYDFLSGDQERLERTRREALAEVDALRALVKEIAEEVFPSPEVRAMLLRDGQGWRKPMMRAAAGMAIAEPVVVVEEPPEEPNRHIAENAVPSPDEVRRCADSVKWGECITFPNGLVIDKRPVQPLPPHLPVTPLSAPTPGMNPPGWICSVCGQWVTAPHYCSRVSTAHNTEAQA